MANKTISALALLLVLLSSCNNDHNAPSKARIELSPELDSAKVQYVRATLKEGARLFKLHCAVCHAAWHNNTEPGMQPLKTVFDTVPRSRLPYFENFVADSKALELKGDAHALALSKHNNSYPHAFIDTLSPKQIHDVVLFIWYDSQGAKKQ